MSFIDFFRPKPKPCTTCGNMSAGLHEVYSSLRHGRVTDKLCTSCLLARLGTLIRGRSILFTEPLTSDGYCFTPLGEVDFEGLPRDRASLALSSRSARCADCTAESRHLWMPLDDLDETAMERLPANKYAPIALEPGQWKNVASLCDEHIAIKLQDYITKKHYWFLNFRFPAEESSGIYW